MSILKVGTIQSTTGNTGLTMANDGTVSLTVLFKCLLLLKISESQNQTDTQFVFNSSTDTHSIVDLSNNRAIIMANMRTVLFKFCIQT